MAVPYTFSTATGSLPLSQLDSNFSTAITIGNTAVVLGDSITTINNLTLGNVAITSVSTAFPNGYLANSNVIVGTTTLTLGSTVTSINGLSLSNVTISSGNVTISNVTTTNVTATTANVTTANVGTLVVIGDATVGGNTTVTGNITAAKGTFTSANVTGTANVQVIAVTQNATVAGNVTVTGNVSAANGTFTSANVSGAANVSTLAVISNVTIGGNATVTGNVSMNVATITTANVSGTANISTLVVTGTSALVGVATLTANPVLSAGTANGVTYLNGSKSLTSGTGLVFDGTNLGIGVASPSNAKLDILTGNINLSDTYILAWGGSTARPNIEGSKASNYLKFSTGGGTTHMMIDSSGNVGIGATPITKLDVTTGDGGAATNAFFVRGTTGVFGLYPYLDATNGCLINSYNAAISAYKPMTFQASSFAWQPNGTLKMTLDASGNLLVGTTSVLTAGKFSLQADLSTANAITMKDSGTTYGFSSYYTLYQNSAGSTVGGIGHTATTSLGINATTDLQFFTANTERMRIDAVGNAQFQAGAVMPYAPAPAGISAATTLTNANIQGQIISATGTTYTITMPLGTTLETLATWATTNIAYDFFVINTASGVITMAVNTNVTSLGSLTVAIGASAHFRIRRTAANTFVLYRLV